MPLLSIRILTGPRRAPSHRATFKKRFARYAKQFGAMSYVEYKGLAGVKNVRGTTHYELAYLVRAAAPLAGAAILIVTAVDGRPGPGITDFDFKESAIRLNF
jgi:hypothetical protein